MTQKRKRDAYVYWQDLPTRWADNDLYGHVNNATYYGFFDTVVNSYLIERAGLEIHAGPVIGLVVETGCSYYLPIAFPECVEAGLRVEHLGNSSVRYELGLFAKHDTQPRAQGYFVHVYVDRETRRPVALPDALRANLAELSQP
jgi:acyl-CoA thioester hydrolase